MTSPGGEGFESVHVVGNIAMGEEVEACLIRPSVVPGG